MGTMAAALARLLGGQGQLIEDRAAATHTAVADRVFRALGPLGAPVRVVHDVVADGVHATVRAGLGGAGVLGGMLAEQVDDDLLLASTRGRTLVGVVLGLVGDTIRRDEPDLAWPTVLLRRDGTVAASSDGPPASATEADELVVLLHGLCETELSWTLGTGPQRPSLVDVLAAEHRDVLLARVNSGLRPAEVGAQLSTLLEQLAGAGRPRVVLVGHSMGGLVARAALRTATADGAAWVAGCDTLVTLGTPHLGAPLEKAVDVMVRAGALVPEVDAITRWFDQRSAGIRDLRHGTHDDGGDPGVAVVAAPLPAHVRLHTVAATMAGVAGTVLGDGMVRPVSAHGRGVRRPVQARRGPPLDVVAGHIELVTDPAVVAHVAGLVDDRPA